MIAVKSKVPVVYYPRTNKQAFIIIEAKSINPSGDFYVIEIIDYIEYETTNNDVTFTKREVLEKREPLFLPKDLVSNMFSAIGESITSEDNYFEKDKYIKQIVVLQYIQNDLLNDGIHTVYNLLPSQWEIINE